MKCSSAGIKKDQNVNNPGSRTRVVFFGTPEFSAGCLKRLVDSSRYQVLAVVTQPDREAGRGKKLTASAVKNAALERGLPVLQPHSVKKELGAILAELTKLGPCDIGVVVAFGQILPQQLLDFPSAGCVNVHASLLPRWRGAAPIHRAIIEGDSESGVCLMKMEAGLDTGAVYSSSKIKIGSDDTTGSLHDKLAEAGATLLERDLQTIAQGQISATSQPSEGITYAKKISNDEAHIDWSQDAAKISRLIRGLNPAPGAFTQLRGQRLKIYRASVKPAAAIQATPGSVATLANSQLEIQCGYGILALDEVQFEGKKRMPIAEFLRGGMVSREDLLS